MIATYVASRVKGARLKETRQLAQFVATTTYDDIPSAVREHTKTLLLDNLGCGFVGVPQTWSKIVSDMVYEAGGNPDCTVIGENWRTSPSGATLANGVKIGAFESEHAAPVGVHPGANAFPALLAIGEREHSDGRSFLTAMVVGYELIVRVGEAATRAVEDKRGFHTPATNGVFGAAAAVGKVLGFDDSLIVNALGIAGSHCSGLLEFKWEGAMTKRLHLGRGGQLGLESALLAQKGFTGPSTVLEGRHGYLNVFSSESEPEKLVEDLGRVWFTKDRQYIKPYACHGSQLPIVDALQRLKAERSLDPSSVRSLDVVGSRHMAHTHNDHAPESLTGAQYSMPFTVAMTLLHDMNNPYVLTEEKLWDPEVRELALRINVAEGPKFDEFDPHLDPHAEITIDLDGDRIVIPVAGFKGLPSNPMSFDDVCGKFRGHAVPMVGSQRAESIIETVRHIEDIDDVSSLAEMLAR